MGSHSVTCHPAAVTFQPLAQPKLVLDLAILDGCKAELTWVVVISHLSRYLRITRQAVVWLEVEPATASPTFYHKTTEPPMISYN